MFTIYYKELKELNARSGNKHATVFYNGLTVNHKKQLINYLAQVITDCNHLCNERKIPEAIRYFLDPCKAFRRNVLDKHSQEKHKHPYRTRMECLEELYTYVTETNPTGGIPKAMFDRWNKSLSNDKTTKSLLELEQDMSRYMPGKLMKTQLTFNNLFNKGTNT